GICFNDRVELQRVEKRNLRKQACAPFIGQAALDQAEHAPRCIASGDVTVVVERRKLLALADSVAWPKHMFVAKAHGLGLITETGEGGRGANFSVEPRRFGVSRMSGGGAASLPFLRRLRRLACGCSRLMAEPLRICFALDPLSFTRSVASG